MKTIIAGSRCYENCELSVDEAVGKSGFKITEVVCGMARGADLSGKSWAEQAKIPVKEFPANWRPKGIKGPMDRAAGYKRNIDMGNYAESLIAVWDGRSRGTKHMIDIATVKGLKVFVYYPD